MRKLINSTYITLDGAVADPQLWPSLGDGGRDEAYNVQLGLLEQCDALLMGRHTYESFASVWPTRSGDSLSDGINAMPKVVVSSTLQDPSWHNTTVIRQDLVGEVTSLKQFPGKDILQYGLGPVSFTLIKHGLLDEIRLWLHPLILGQNGPQLPHFRDCPPMQLNLTDTRTLPNGIAILTCQVSR